MYLLYGIVFILITIQTNGLSAMDVELSPEQDDLITTITTYREMPHRISFDKIGHHKAEIKKLFNKTTQPTVYYRLKKKVAKTEIDKSILILSVPNKNKVFDKEDCITEIIWLSTRIISLKERGSPVQHYCARQIARCNPKCLQQLQNDLNFINQTHDNLIPLIKYNPRFITTETSSRNKASAQEIKHCIARDFINVSDSTLMPMQRNDVLSELRSYEKSINTLTHLCLSQRKDVIITLREAYDNYNRIDKKMAVLRHAYNQSLITIQITTPEDLCYSHALAILIAAHNNGTLAMHPDLHKKFMEYTKETTFN